MKIRKYTQYTLPTFIMLLSQRTQAAYKFVLVTCMCASPISPLLEVNTLSSMKVSYLLTMHTTKAFTII